MVIVTHIVLWDHLEGITDEEKQVNAAAIKAALEALLGVIPGMLEINVYTQLLESSNADLALVSIHESPEALLVYRDHPEHVRVATEVVRPKVSNRRCADFERG